MKSNPKFLKLRMPIAKRISKIRLKQGLSQNAFAKEIGIAQTTILKIERGNWFPSASFLIAIYKCYGISADYILFGKNNEKNN